MPRSNKNKGQKNPVINTNEQSVSPVLESQLKGMIEKQNEMENRLHTKAYASDPAEKGRLSQDLSQCLQESKGLMEEISAGASEKVKVKNKITQIHIKNLILYGWFYERDVFWRKSEFGIMKDISLLLKNYDLNKGTIDKYKEALSYVSKQKSIVENEFLIYRAMTFLLIDSKEALIVRKESLRPEEQMKDKKIEQLVEELSQQIKQFKEMTETGLTDSYLKTKAYIRLAKLAEDPRFGGAVYV